MLPIYQLIGRTLYNNNLVNNNTRDVKESPLPECKDDKCLADTFADYFIEKIQKIWDALEDHPLYAPTNQEVPTIEEFIPFIEEGIVKIISNMEPKCCKLDVLQPTLLKKLLQYIIKPITYLINTSLSNGVFASNWKTTIIKPLLKKPGLELMTKITDWSAT